METADLLKKVRKIEIKTKGLSQAIFSGEYQSAFKGRGMSFSEVRQYSFGDDVRAIDWNVSARYHEPFVKVFEEERELTDMIIVDASKSNAFGTVKQYKQDMIAEISAVLSFSAITNNDKVGLILFTDTVEHFIPPKKGKSHILRIIRDILEYQPISGLTNLSVPLDFLSNAVKRRCTAFLLSDFKGDGYEDSLRIVSRKHDLVGVRIYDPFDMELPNIGLIHVEDMESGKKILLDTSSNSLRSQYKNRQLAFEQYHKRTFSKLGVDTLNLRTDEDYVKGLRQFFKKRGALR
jgi:uncharacterized protein (DUF58 family)